MPDPDQYAAQLAASLHDDWQYSRVFATPHARPAFTALLALRAEMRNVLAQAADPSVRTLRFEWWRGEIERGFRGQAQHPLVHALGKHMPRASGATECCLEMIDAAEAEGEDSGFESAQDFFLYLHRSGGVLAEQLALIEGITDRHALDAAQRLGRLKRFGDLLALTGAMLRAGRWLFPAEWLSKRALTPATVMADENREPALALLTEMLDLLDVERVATRTAMEGAALPASLHVQWTLAQHDYRLLRGQPQRMLAPQPRKGSSLVRLWMAWRGARASTVRAK